MKTSVCVRFVALAVAISAPLAAVAQDSDTTEACVSAFVAQNFPGQAPIIRVSKEEASYRMPLILNSGSVTLKLSAASRESGRVLATAMCTGKRGVVKLTPDNSAALIAAR